MPIPVGSAPTGVAISPDGNRAYVTNNDSSVSVIDTATNTVVDTIPIAVTCSAGNGMAVSPDDSTLYVTDGCGEPGPLAGLSVIDIATHAAIATILLDVVAPYDIAISPDGSKVYVSAARGGVMVIDAATNAVTTTIGVGGVYGPRATAITPDGSKIYAPGVYYVWVIDTATNTLVNAIAPPERLIFTLALPSRPTARLPTSKTIKC